MPAPESTTPTSRCMSVTYATCCASSPPSPSTVSSRARPTGGYGITGRGCGRAATPAATTCGKPTDTDAPNAQRDALGTRRRRPSTQTDARPYRDVCGKCGATRVDQQLGLEATPDLYVAAMVDVFREVRRVLRRDGTCWVNLGDSYASRRGPARQAGAGMAANADVREGGTDGITTANDTPRATRPEAEGPGRYPVAGRVRACRRTAGTCAPTLCGRSRTRCRSR